MSSINVNQIFNSAGTEVYTVKAWVNFNGTGTVAIRSSGNVSSISDNGVGAFTVNFTTAMPDVNYSVVAMTGNAGSGTATTVSALAQLPVDGTYSTGAVAIRTFNISNAVDDYRTVSVAIFR